MADNFKELIKAVMANDELKKAYEVEVHDVTGEAYTKALLAFAENHGFELTVADIEEAVTPAEGELVEDELMAVSGGNMADETINTCSAAAKQSLIENIAICGMLSADRYAAND